MVPLEKYYDGIFNFDISLTRITSPSRHLCNWLERFARVSILTSIECGSSGGLASKSSLVEIELRFCVLPFLCGLGTSDDLSPKMHFLGNDMGFQGQS
jgi:hypothetical protein